MKILVPVKQVASLDEDFVLGEDGAVSSQDLDWQLNEWDSFSLEAALQLNEGEDGEVVAVTVGDEQVEQNLRSCLAKGADRAIRVWDDSLRGADALAIASVLAAVARSEQPDLVLCGVQSSDAVESATGVALAGLLDLAHVAVVTGIERAGERLTVQRELEGGVVELLGVSLPCLLTVQTGINEPRYASLRAIKQASAKPLDVSSLADVGLDAGTVAAHAGSHTTQLHEPTLTAGATMIEGGTAEIAARIAEIVKGAMSA
ncbi:MAG TPA: electron transfer flavoprotein subunit beta/FixA family protein [Solirubrobacteraceae bacterium]|nr:electron transfer flavoprotein subunit beta/FixA family protein [Solirubrobacteraceae bacterium]